MDWRMALLAALGLAVLSATWAMIQKWAGRNVGEEYDLQEESEACSSCRESCRGIAEQRP
jgi:hypothetical protein